MIKYDKAPKKEDDLYSSPLPPGFWVLMAIIALLLIIGSVIAINY